MNDQRSVTDQLRSLIKLANQAGLYDAADWIKTKAFPTLYCDLCDAELGEVHSDGTKVEQGDCCEKCLAEQDAKKFR